MARRSPLPLKRANPSLLGRRQVGILTQSDEAIRSPGSRWVLGIDEAGRGSVVGPLVVGGFLVQEHRLAELAPLGVRDSKLLTPAARERVYRRLPEVGRCCSIPLSPAQVDAAVRRNELNLLEARAFADLIRRTRPDLSYVDACDPVAARFGRTVSALAGGIGTVHAQHGADRSLPVVGAASIVAKVRRDRAVARLARSLQIDVGSGYPSDGRTVACVRTALSDRPIPAPWIRHSWKTAERLKPPARIVPLDRFGA
jgi:ribonuclease HII